MTKPPEPLQALKDARANADSLYLVLAGAACLLLAGTLVLPLIIATESKLGFNDPIAGWAGVTCLGLTLLATATAGYYGRKAKRLQREFDRLNETAKAS